MDKKISKTIGQYSYILSKDAVLVKKNKQLLRSISLGIVLDTAFTIPPKTGVCYRLYYLSEELIKNGIDVKLFLCNRNYKNDEEVKTLSSEKDLEIHLIPEKIFYNPNSLLNVLKTIKLDAIQFEDSETAIFLGRYLKNKLKIPLFLELHDDETVLKRSIGGYKHSDTQLADFIHYASGEIVDLVIAMTEGDLISFVRIGISTTKLTLAPNGIDQTLFRYYGPNIKERNIIFIGNMFYPPNRQAAEIILKDILPKLKPHNFQATFVGMAPEELIDKYTEIPGVNFTGFVDDINKELKKATLALSPVVAGSGMKVKILNFAAAGLPIISTTIGANGYEKLSGIILEDNFGKYQKIIQKLIQDKNQAKKIGKQNRRDVVKHFSWSKIAKKLSSTYRVCIANNSHPLTNKNGYREIDIPKPFWLSEKRVKTNENRNYYLIKNGKINKEKL
jgi:glycosyltransferase involved in cell wall biosynthesis